MPMLRTLGELRLDGGAFPRLLSPRKELVLLAYVARRAPRSVDRAELAELLWEGRGSERARQSLRQALLDLRRALDGALEVEADAIRVRGEALRLDILELELALDRGDHQAAVELWAGEFLAGIESTAGEELRAWIETEREGLRGQLRTALEHLVRDARQRAAWPEAIAAAERWVELLPHDERGHYQLAELLLLAGRPAEAQVRYVRGAALLRNGLGAEPGTAYLELGLRIERAAVRSQPCHGVSAAPPVPDFVGRAAALGELESAWRSVLEGGSTVVLVEGEAGIGKTRLVDEFLLRLSAGHRPPVVATPRCADIVAAAELESVAELVRCLADAPGLGGAPASALAELARFAPEVRARFPALPEPSSANGAVGGALVEAFAAVSAEQPVVIFVDGAALVDDSSAAAFRSLLRRLPPSVIALATATSGGGPPAAGLAAFASAPGILRLTLRPLDRTEVGALLGSMIALPPDQQADLTARLFAEAGGNPGYTVELVRAMMDAGRLRAEGGGGWRIESGAHDALPIPIAIRESVERRLAALDAELRVVVEAAVVLGGGLNLGAVAAVARLEPATTAAGFDGLLARGLIGSPDRDAAMPALRPAILGRVAYDLIPSARRAVLHRAAAKYFAARGRHDPAARAAATHHRQLARQSPVGRHRERWLAVGSAAALVAATALGFSAGADPAAERAEVPRIAVLPFEVRGRDGIAHLREGLPELLSAALDGGTVEAMAPRQLLTRSGAEDDAVSPRRAAALALQLGATEILLGRVVGASGRVRVRVELLTAAERPEPIGVAEADGNADDVFALADALARKLLVQPGAAGGDRTSELAATATPSLPALKAYLEGRRELKALRIQPAIAAFRRAVDDDSAFALAWHGLALAYSWSARGSDALDAAKRAIHPAPDLPTDYLLMLQAHRELLNGAPDEAERLYRRAIAIDHTNVEAWHGLGEALFHYNWARGRPIGLAWAALGAAVERDPGHGLAAAHLAELAALEGRTAELDSLIAGLTARWPLAARQQRLDVLRAFLVGEASEQSRILAELRDTLPYYTWSAVRTVALFGRNFDGAERLARVWTGNRGDFAPIYHFVLADLALARGRWRTAQAELRSGAVVRSLWALEHRALLALSPAVSLPLENLAALRDELAARDPAADRPSVYPHQSIRVPQEIRPLTRLFLLGLLSGRLGESAAAERYAVEVETAGDGPHAPLARSMGREIRAHAALVRGDAATALRFLEADTLAFPDERVRFSPVYARVSARWTRAEALRLAGRPHEALGWYHSIVGQNLHELVYLAPAELRRGRIYESLGMLREARRSYRAALEQWRDADPDVDALRSEAVRRLARLEEG